MGSYRCSSLRLTSWRLQEQFGGWAALFLCSFLCLSRSLSFLLYFPWCAAIFLGQARAKGKGELATGRHCADSREETDCT